MSKKHDSLIVNSSSVKNKVSEQLEDIKKKESLSPQQVDTMKHHLVMLQSCRGKGKITEPLFECNFEGAESPDIPVTVQSNRKRMIKKFSRS